MNDLRLDLSGAADSFELPPGDVDAVVARARDRARRRQRLVASTAALALVATSVAGLRLLAGGDPTTSVAAGGHSLRLGDGDIAWELADSSSVLSLLRQNPTTAAPSGRLYALSTAPGEADLGQDLPRVVWQSDDGVDWAAAPLSDDIFLADLAASDERIYAVGTGPATAAVAGDGAVPEVVVGWSDDGAGSWETAALDIDLPAIAEASRSVHINPESLAVASTREATVAVASITADLDVPRFLPDGVSAPHGWAFTPEGVDLLGPYPGTCPEGTVSADPDAPDLPAGRVAGPECYSESSEAILVSPQESRGVTQSFTWDELGVTGDVRQAALGQPMAFVAPPGSSDFERVPLPLDQLGGFGLSLHADDQGFLLVSPSVVQGPDGASVLTSDDGRRWSAPASLPGGLGWVSAAGQVGDTFVILGQGVAGEATVVTDSGGGWQVQSLAELLGTELAEVTSAAIGPEGVVALVSGLGGEDDGTYDPHVLVSGDARTWSAQSIRDLIDEPVASVGQPVITGDRTVVPVAPARPRDRGEHLTQIALVATLP